MKRSLLMLPVVLLLMAAVSCTPCPTTTTTTSSTLPPNYTPAFSVGASTDCVAKRVVVSFYVYVSNPDKLDISITAGGVTVQRIQAKSPSPDPFVLELGTPSAPDGTATIVATTVGIPDDQITSNLSYLYAGTTC